MTVFHELPGPEGKQAAFNHSFGSASISLRATSYLEGHFGGFSAFLSTPETQKSLHVWRAFHHKRTSAFDSHEPRSTDRSHLFDSQLICMSSVQPVIELY